MYYSVRVNSLAATPIIVNVYSCKYCHIVISNVLSGRKSSVKVRASLYKSQPDSELISILFDINRYTDNTYIHTYINTDTHTFGSQLLSKTEIFCPETQKVESKYEYFLCLKLSTDV